MTPADHGYVKCKLCQCWRPKGPEVDRLDDQWECMDWDLCDKLKADRRFALHLEDLRLSGGIPRGPELNEEVGG